MKQINKRIYCLQMLQSGGSAQKTPPAESTPPPLPPKGVQKEWINFEEIPERQKPPRRIQTIPSRGQIEAVETEQHENIVYSYVNPEDCKCECHEIARGREHREHYRDYQDKLKEQKDQKEQKENPPLVHEDEVPLLCDDCGDEDKSTQDSVERLKIDARADSRSIIRYFLNIAFSLSPRTDVGK